MLTNVVVQRAKVKSRAYKLADGGGLVLHVSPAGTKSWRWRLRIAGKETTLTLGAWPELSLEEARLERDRRRAMLDRGEDPRATIADEATRPSTFEPAARRWLAFCAPGWSAQHAAELLARFERDVFPAIGAMRLDEVAPQHVLQLLRVIEGRGHVNTARRLRQSIHKSFAYARSEGWTTNQPAADVIEAMIRPRAAQHRPALKHAAELRQLLDEADRVVGAPAVKLAARFLALTAVRVAALRGARWCEIEDLDGAEPIWRVPAARMKLKADKKADAVNDHLVPLSAAAVELLRAARLCVTSATDDPACVASGGIDDTQLIFTSRRRRDPIGKKAIGNLLERTSFAGRHVPHGWRASFSSILNLELPDERGAIEKALAHAGGREAEELGINRAVEAAYNRSVDLPRRRALFDRWAEILVGDASPAPAEPSCYDADNDVEGAIAA